MTPGGIENVIITKLFCILYYSIFGRITFSQKYFRSNDHFGKMTFRSNDHFGQMTETKFR
jgi:hypothetical protein